MTERESSASADSTAEDLNRRTTALADRLKRHALSASERVKAFAKLAASGMRSAQVVVWLESTAAVTQGTEDLEGSRKALLTEWKDLVNTAYYRLDADLREECQKRGWTVDGHWPELYIERGICLRADDSDKSIKVGRKRLSSPSIDELVRVLATIVPQLVPPSFSTMRFIELLVGAYDATPASGVQKPLLAVYRSVVVQMQGKDFWKDAQTDLFEPLSADQFRARFAKMLEAGVTKASDGRQLRLLPPLNPKDALFLYQPAEQRFGYVGRIEFT